MSCLTLAVRPAITVRATLRPACGGELHLRPCDPVLTMHITPLLQVGGGANISADPGNRAVAGTDGGVYVRDDLVPDPLAYYILAKT